MVRWKLRELSHMLDNRIMAAFSWGQHLQERPRHPIEHWKEPLREKRETPEART